MNTKAAEAAEDSVIDGDKGAIVEVKADQALVTIDPEKYAAAAFEPFKKKFSAAKRAVGKVGDYDITTTAGMKQAKELRASFREVRLGIENARKDAKAPVIEAGKKIDAVAKEMTAEVEPFEDKFDAQIKAEEQRKEEEKQRAIEAERVRVEAIENRIANIRDTATRLAGAGSEVLDAAISEWSTKRLEPADFEEFLEPALTALNTTVDALRVLHGAALEREAEQRRIAAERAELERLRAENEARAKAEAEEAEKRERDAQAERAAAAAREAELKRELEAMRAQLEASKPTPAPTEAPTEAPTPAPTEVPTEAPTAAPVSLTGTFAKSVNYQFQEVGADARPSDEDIVSVLAVHYDESAETVAGWLREFAL